MQNELIYKRTKVYAPILIGISCLVGILFLRPVYATYIEKTTLITEAEKELSMKQAEYEKLMSLFSKEKDSALMKKVDKIDHKMVTTDIMREVLFNDYTKSKSAYDTPRIKIGPVSVDKGSKLPNGLSLGTVSLSIDGKSMNDVIDFLTFLTMESRHIYLLEGISLPIDTEPDALTPTQNGYGMGVSLGVYYFD